VIVIAGLVILIAAVISAVTGVLGNTGSPRGTGPSTATPCPARSAARLAQIATITAISRPGILRSTQRAVSTITMHAGRLSGRSQRVPGETPTLKGQRAAIAAAGTDWLPAVCDLWSALRPVTGRQAGEARRG
jgi:hypothetical protein